MDETAEHAKGDGRAKPTIGYATLGRRLCTALRYVRTTRAFREQCGLAGWSTVQGIVKDSGLSCNHGMMYNDLANVHVSGRINDINLDVWPIL